MKLIQTIIDLLAQLFSKETPEEILERKKQLEYSNQYFQYIEEHTPKNKQYFSLETHYLISLEAKKVADEKVPNVKYTDFYMCEHKDAENYLKEEQEKRDRYAKQQKILGFKNKEKAYEEDYYTHRNVKHHALRIKQKLFFKYQNSKNKLNIFFDKSKEISTYDEAVNLLKEIKEYEESFFKKELCYEQQYEAITPAVLRKKFIEEQQVLREDDYDKYNKKKEENLDCLEVKSTIEKILTFIEKRKQTFQEILEIFQEKQKLKIEHKEFFDKKMKEITEQLETVIQQSLGWKTRPAPQPVLLPPTPTFLRPNRIQRVYSGTLIMESDEDDNSVEPVISGNAAPAA